MQRSLLGALCGLLIATTAAAQDDCDDRLLLRQLYFYSLFSEAADTGQVPLWRCQLPDGSAAPPIPMANTQTGGRTTMPACESIFHSDPSCIHRISTQYVIERMNMLDDIVTPTGEEQHVGVYEAETNGPAYIACGTDPAQIKMFVTLSHLLAQTEDDNFRQRILVPAIWRIEPEIDEGLETVTLNRVYPSSNDNGPHDGFADTITAIKGTDILSRPNWRASLNDLSGGSCVFEVVARIVGDLAGEQYSNYAVAGHSLGGSVAQYVAQSHNTSPNGVNFEAYAFNAIGLDESRGVDPDTLNSFYIEGDPVVYIGASRDRIQGGRLSRFIMPTSVCR